MTVCFVQDATSENIRLLFAQFGTIKPQNGAITVKHNGNNNSFAYVDFVDVASAQACVEAKDVQLNGVTVCSDSCLSQSTGIAIGIASFLLCKHFCPRIASMPPRSTVVGCLVRRYLHTECWLLLRRPSCFCHVCIQVHGSGVCAR